MKTRAMPYPALAIAAAVALALPAAAGAHVTLQPEQAPAGSYSELLMRVPNEEDRASTTKIDVALPAGFASVFYERRPGWSVKVMRHKLAKPIQAEGGPITEQVSEMIFTATDRRAAIAPGQFMDFPLSVQIPGKAGDKLTFKALQTYSNGDVVRWIGPPASEHPAPQVTVTAPTPEGAATHSAGAATDGGAAGGGGASTGLALAGVVLGALGLLAALAALVLLARRRDAAAPVRQPGE